MRILFDLGHPAHFHLFKNVIHKLKEEGHLVEIIARQKDCLLELLEKSNFSYHLIKRKRNGLLPLLWQNIRALAFVIWLGWKSKIDFMVGTSIIIGPASRISRSKSLFFGEDDAKVVPVFAKFSYPFVHYVVTPKCLEFEKHGSKHLTYPGYQELAYLHPNRYEPDKNIRKELTLKDNERYFLIRLVSLTAHHDIGEMGISTEQAKTLINILEKHGRVFISAEKTVDESLNKYILPVSAKKILDVMSYADIVIGDSQTMTAEAAVLGVPSIRCNTFVGRLAYLDELEKKYELSFGFLPHDFDKLLETVHDLLNKEDLKKIWHDKRQIMLKDCIDLSEWIYNKFIQFEKDKHA